MEKKGKQHHHNLLWSHLLPANKWKRLVSLLYQSI